MVCLCFVEKKFRIVYLAEKPVWWRFRRRGRSVSAGGRHWHHGRAESGWRFETIWVKAGNIYINGMYIKPHGGYSVRGTGRKLPLGFAKHSQVVLYKEPHEENNHDLGWLSSPTTWSWPLATGVALPGDGGTGGVEDPPSLETSTQELWPLIIKIWDGVCKNINNYTLFQYLDNVDTSWRGVVSRGHLGSSDFEGVLLAKDLTHRLSLSPDFINCQLFRCKRWQKD